MLPTFVIFKKEIKIGTENNLINGEMTLLNYD